MIVANDASNMQKSTNEIYIIKGKDSIKSLPEKKKEKI